MIITFPCGNDYETGDMRATCLLTPDRAKGVWKSGERITATYLPGADGHAMFCISSGSGGNYLKQSGDIFTGGAWPHAVSTAFVMSPRGRDWLLEIFAAERVVKE